MTSESNVSPSSAPGVIRPDGLWLDDLAAGMTFRSGEYELTAAEIVEFAERYDPQAFHTDADAATSTFFQGLAASGWHTAALTMRLFSEAVPLATGIIGAEITLKWTSPTRPGDVLRVEATIEDIAVSASRPDRAAVLFSYATLNQDGATRQQTSGRVLAWRRPADG